MSADAALALRRAIFPVFRRGAESEPPLPPTPEELRERARTDGNIQGLLEGRAEGFEQAAEQIAALKSALQGATAALAARAAALASEVEETLPAIVNLVVRKVLDHELADDAVASALARAVAARFEAQGAPVVLRLEPATVALLDTAASAPSVRIEADPSLRRGDWMVEAPAALFDGRLESQLDEVLRHLQGRDA